VRLLLDTHAALWWIGDDKRLPASARRTIARAKSVRFFSVASAWELSIKSSLGELQLPNPSGKFLEEHLPANRIELLAITFGDLNRVEGFPFHHGDPFDRLIAAQALERDLAIVSADRVFDAYGVKRIW
jgi:PIN domain nuclease of toxin-antitoxin system